MKSYGRILGILAALSLCILCAGCSKAVSITVNDSGNSQLIESKTKITVADALNNAGITLNEGDQTDPAGDTKLTEDITAITIKRLCKVSIQSDEDTIDLEVLGGTVQDAIEQSGVTLAEGQYVKEDPETWLTDGMQIHLIQKLEVTVTADGEKQQVFTEAETVQELLDELKIELGKKDRVSPELTTKLTDKNRKVKVQRVKEKKEVETEEVAFEKEYKNSSSMDKGQSQVTTKGVAGEKEITYKVTYVDGKEESRKVVNEEVTKKPVNEVVTVGTRETAPATTAAPTKAPTKAQTKAPTKAPTTTAPTKAGKTVVSKEKVLDCDGSGHGYYIITYSDGSIKYEDF